MIDARGSSSKSHWIYNKTKREGIEYKNDINMPRNVHILNYKFNIGYRDIRKFKETKLTKKLNKIIIPFYSKYENKI